MIVVGIGGSLESGKDTVARRLTEHWGFERRGFADALKVEVRNTLPRTLLTMTRLWWDAAGLSGWPGDEQAVDYMVKTKPPWLRVLLQEYGSELRRGDDPDYWVDQWLLATTGWRVPVDWRVAVPDVRFENEARCLTTLRAHGHTVALVRVERPGHAGDGHVSERGLDGWTRWDAVFKNDGTVSDLWTVIDQWAATQGWPA